MLTFAERTYAVEDERNAKISMLDFILAQFAAKRVAITILSLGSLVLHPLWQYTFLYITYLSQRYLHRLEIKTPCMRQQWL